MRVHLKIDSHRRGADGRMERMAQEQRAYLSAGSGEITLTYQDQAEGLEQSQVVLRLDEGRCRMERSGQAEMRLDFVPGNTHCGLYRVDGMEFELSAFTNRLDWRFEEGRLELTLCYELSLSGGQPAKTRLALRAWPVEA